MACDSQCKIDPKCVSYWDINHSSLTYSTATPGIQQAFLKHYWMFQFVPQGSVLTCHVIMVLEDMNGPEGNFAKQTYYKDNALFTVQNIIVYSKNNIIQNINGAISN